VNIGPSPSTSGTPHSTSGAARRSARTTWRRFSGTASRSPVREPTPPSSGRSPEEISAAPTPEKLELLEACLWVIPDFLKRAEGRKPDVYEYVFKGQDGEMSLDLSWVSKERLSVDRLEGKG